MIPMRRIRRVHFVGIGGVGMSGIAEVLHNQGYQVSGSDVAHSAALERLSRLGVTCHVGHDAQYVEGMDVVVVSSAVNAGSNPELVAAENARIPVIARAEMLAELMRFRYGIAIAGTHGKTTTTSLVASLLAEAGFDPTFVIGGRLNSAGTNARLGTGRYLVAEADESDASFLRLKPMVSIVTNIDADHMATYAGDMMRLRQAFLDFLHHLPFYGLAVICLDDPVLAELLPEIHRPVITYGFHPEADLRIIDYVPNGLKSEFKVQRRSVDEILSFTLNLPGRHNVSNATAALVVALEEGVAVDNIAHAFDSFAGIGRRFQVHSDINSTQGKVTFIDDYGHHPNELKATIQTFRESFPQNRLVLVFQPHRYTRTRDLFDDFANVLSTTDLLIVLDVYSAGETMIPGADGRTLCRAIRQRGQVDPIFVEHMEELPGLLNRILQSDDKVLLQGAGNIGQFIARCAAAGSIDE